MRAFTPTGGDVIAARRRGRKSNAGPNRAIGSLAFPTLILATSRGTNIRRICGSWKAMDAEGLPAHSAARTALQERRALPRGRTARELVSSPIAFQDAQILLILVPRDVARMSVGKLPSFQRRVAAGGATPARRRSASR